MKFRKASKWLALTICLLLVMAPLASAASPKGSIDKIQDNELVINTLNDKGQIEDIKVLTHLRVFGKGDQKIEDRTAYGLSSVRNLYGKEKIELKNGKLSIPVKIDTASGFSDTYYLAELKNKEVSKVKHPVSVKVKYYLDGKPMEASKLAGKSGHLKIVCELENLTGEKKELEYENNEGEIVKTEATVYTPYVVSLSGWELDNKKFTHVKAPGVAGKSPEGVVADIQGKTTVNWSAPLVPPKYPAKQYTVLETDAKDIELPSFKIAVIPIVPTTAEEDSLGTVEDSLLTLYGAFDSIEGGIGAPDKDATLLFGLNAIKGGLNQLSEGLGTLVGKVATVNQGLSKISSGLTTAQGGLNNQVVPAMQAQKQVVSGVQQVIGGPGTPVAPGPSTSVYNDVSYLRVALAGTPAEAVITQAIQPKLQAANANLGVLRDGGNLITPQGAVPFPASISTVQSGVQQVSAGLGQANAGIGQISTGLGSVGSGGQPVMVMSGGKPATIIAALGAMQQPINQKMIPGVVQLEEGASKIGDGSSQAKEGITEGLDTFASIPAITSVLEENAEAQDSFLGKPQGAEGTVSYVYQTQEVSRDQNAMNVGIIIIIAAFIILFAIGRAPQQVAPSEGISKEA